MASVSPQKARALGALREMSRKPHGTSTDSGNAGDTPEPC